MNSNQQRARLRGGPRRPGLRVGLIATLVAISTASGVTVSPGTASAVDTFCGKPIVEQGQGSWDDQLNSEADLFYDKHIEEIAHAIGQGQWVCVPMKLMIEKSVETIAERGVRKCS